MTTIGVLALQGDFLEHEAVLRCLGVDAVQVRKSENLRDLDGRFCQNSGLKGKLVSM
jgi:5'-phosphate synthase pdxT subunit